MKKSSLLKVAVLAMPLIFAACGSKKKVVTDDKPVVVQTGQAQFLQKVKDNAQTTKFITSKVKFSVEVGAQNIALKLPVWSSPRTTCLSWTASISST